MNRGDTWTGYDLGDAICMPGVDWGPQARPGPSVVYRNGEYAVLKVPGSSQWASRGFSSYVPTKYLLVHLRPSKGRRQGAPRVIVIIYKEVAPGRKWLSAVKDLKARADKLEASR